MTKVTFTAQPLPVKSTTTVDCEAIAKVLDKKGEAIYEMTGDQYRALYSHIKRLRDYSISCKVVMGGFRKIVKKEKSDA